MLVKANHILENNNTLKECVVEKMLVKTNT